VLGSHSVTSDVVLIITNRCMHEFFILLPAYTFSDGQRVSVTLGLMANVTAKNRVSR
jgi:hypothetical protein